MSAPGSAPLGPPGPPAPRRGGTATPALPSAPRRVYCLWCVKWLGTVPDHVCLQKANRTRCDRCTKNASACLKVGWVPVGCLGDASNVLLDPPRFRTVVAKIQADAAALPGLPTARRTPAKNALVIAAATLGSRVDKHNRRMKKESGDRKSLSLESLLARLDSLESAYRTAHGQPPAFLDDDDSDDEGDDGGDDDGDGGGDGDGAGAAGVGAGGS
ncbi:MAG: hypothetical protein M1816_005724 [Peltula sp. TS41687]|nr:MAG: hypothetical protein M1816_005724 [Peltula sp. TS41687]